MPLGQMAFMIGSMPSWFISMITQESIDIATFKRPIPPKDAKELVASFDGGVKEVQQALSDMDEKSLDGNWVLKVNGKVMMELSRRIMLSQTIRHLVHHRAQLGVYLKMNGISHPAIYGPSGDEAN